jgi:hypothetical protein
LSSSQDLFKAANSLTEAAQKLNEAARFLKKESGEPAGFTVSTTHRSHLGISLLTPCC